MRNAIQKKKEKKRKVYAVRHHNGSLCLKRQPRRNAIDSAARQAFASRHVGLQKEEKKEEKKPEPKEEKPQPPPKEEKPQPPP